MQGKIPSLLCCRFGPTVTDSHSAQSSSPSFCIPPHPACPTRTVLTLPMLVPTWPGLSICSLFWATQGKQMASVSVCHPVGISVDVWNVCGCVCAWQ